VRAIFVDGDPARSQYISWGGHEAPQWLWDAGFVEGGSGATHPDFQRTGLYVALMQHLFRVAAQSGHRYVLGACPDNLLEVYRDMGFEVLEERMVEPKPGWRFRSHLIVADAERVVRDATATTGVAAMASAISFAGLPVAA
jgi:GNAT superfamily N-acetyltransferase